MTPERFGELFARLFFTCLIVVALGITVTVVAIAVKAVT